MSGKKRIHVDEREWLELQRKAKRLTKMNNELPKLAGEMRDRLEAEIARANEALNHRQAQITQLAGQLSEDNRRLREESDRRIRSHTLEVRNTLDEALKTSRSETLRLLDDQTRAFRTQLDQERMARQRAAEAIRRRLDAQDEDLDAAKAQAERYLADSRATVEMIETLPHERFAPGQLDAALRRLGTADSIVDGQPVAGLAMAAAAYHELTDLSLQVHQAADDWQAARLSAYGAITTVLNRIDENATTDLLEDDGTVMRDARLDVVHWSVGDWSALRAEVLERLGRLTGDSTLTVEQLRAVVDADGPLYLSRLGEIVDEAALRQLASQRRVNVAETIVDRLEERTGYSLVDHTYRNGDEREAFYAKLEGINGNHIVIDVAPDGGPLGGYSVSLLQYDYDETSETDLRARADEAYRALQGEGIAVDRPQTEAGAPDQTLLDFEALRRPPEAEGGTA